MQAECRHGENRALDASRVHARCEQEVGSKQRADRVETRLKMQAKYRQDENRT